MDGVRGPDESMSRGGWCGGEGRGWFCWRGRKSIEMNEGREERGRWFIYLSNS